MLAVAQLHRKLFMPNNTFLYNIIVSFKRILPVCITFQKINPILFPVQTPLIELYRWNFLHQSWRVIQQYVNKNKSVMKYNLPSTFQAINHYDIKVIHAHFGYTGFQALSVKEKTGLPLITTFYGQDISEYPKYSHWTKNYAILFKIGEKFLVEGPFMKKQLIKIGCTKEKIAIQRIAIMQDKYPFHTRKPKTKKEPVRILFCGTFREKKGLEYALKAVAKAYTRFPNLEFRIIGDGKLRPRILRLIKIYEMSKYTRLLGYQQHQSMINEMDRSDIFISPSVRAKNGDSEGGAPTTILEAQACGLPVLSTYHADIPNIVIPGKSALLAPERDVETLSNNLMTLLTEQERWKEMSKTGKNFIKAYHDVHKEVKHLENFYFNLI